MLFIIIMYLVFHLIIDLFIHLFIYSFILVSVIGFAAKRSISPYSRGELQLLKCLSTAKCKCMATVTICFQQIHSAATLMLQNRFSAKWPKL